MVRRSIIVECKSSGKKITQKSFRTMKEKMNAFALVKQIVISMIFLLSPNFLAAQSFDIACPNAMDVECAADIPSFTISDLTILENPCATPGFNMSTFTMTPPRLLPPATNGNCNGDVWTVFLSIENNCTEPAGCSVRITIANDAPTITCPASTTITCLTDVVADIAGTTTTLSCGLAGSVTVSDPVATIGNSTCGEQDGDSYSLTYTISETACNPGRSASCVQVLTIDNDAPTIACPANTTATCSADVVAGTPTITTSCGQTGTIATAGPTLASGIPDCPGSTYSFTYSVVDECNRATSCVQTITIANAAPVIVCPANTTVTCAADIVAGTPTITSGCSLTSTTSVAGPTLTGGVANCNNATYSLVYTVSDGCGRSASCTQTVTLSNAVPTIVCPANATVECTANIAAGTPTITTSCGLAANASVTAPVLLTGTANCDGATYSIVYSVTDGCDRDASCTQIITLDNAAPTITCPANTTAVCAIDITAGTPVTVTSCGLSSTMSTAGPTLTSGLADCDGSTYTIAYTVTDDCNRIATCNQTITLSNVAPTINCTPSLTVECAADIVAQTPTVTTSCGLNTNMTTVGPTLTTGIANCNGSTYSIMYSVTDVCGRNATCNQTITLVNTGPTIVCPVATTVECAADIAVGSPTITTSCGLSPSMTTTGPTLVGGVANCNGASYDIVYSVTDACNRSASCTQRINLVNSGPTITCPADATVQCATGIAAGTPTITTTCGLTSSMTTTGPTLLSGLQNCNGSTYRILYSVSDDCGRSDQCAQTITLANAEPTITCPANATVTCLSDIVAGTPSIITSCGLNSNMSTTGPSLVSGQGSCNGSVYSIVYTAADACGRSDNCMQTFTIVNGGPQIATCPQPATAMCHDNIGTIAAAGQTSLLAGGVNTSCGNAYTVVPVISALTSNCSGTPYTITYTVTEQGCATAQSTSCTQTVTLSNTGLSITSCPPARTTVCYSELASIASSGVLALQTAGVATACGNNYSVSSSVSPFTSDCNGTVYSITYTVAENGCTPPRTSTCVQNVTLANTTTVACPTAPTVEYCDINSYIPIAATVDLPCATGPITVNGVRGNFVGNCSGGFIEVLYSYTAGGCTTVSQPCTVNVSAAPETTITCNIASISSINACDVDTYIPPQAQVNIGCGGTTFISGIKQPYTDGCGGGTLNILYQYDDGCEIVEKTCTAIVDAEPAATITCPTIQAVGVCNMFTFVPPSALVTLGCGGTDIATGVVGTPMVNCSGGSVIVTYTYSGGCNTDPVECNVEVLGDTEGPTLTCPNGLTNLECGDRIPVAARRLAQWDGTISDNCSTTFSNFMVSDSPNVPTRTLTPCAGGVTSIIRTYSVEDDCGQVGSCTQVFSFIPDTEAPAIASCDRVNDIIIQCGAPNMNTTISNWITTSQNSLRPGITDNCSRISNISYGNDYGGVVPAFNCGLGNGLPVNFYAEDECMNRSVCTASIFITDTEAPSAICPPEITGLNCDDDVPAPATTMDEFLMIGGTPGMVMTGSGTTTMTGSGTTTMTGSGTTTMTGSGTSAFDNCAPEVWILSKDDKTKADLTFCDKDGEQKIVRTYYLTDDCGNTTSCTQDIIFNPDLTPPTLTCTDLVLVADPHVCYIDIVLPNPTATDGCSGVKKFENSHVGTQYAVGDTMVTWTVTDSCHNESTCVQNITVLDQQSPSIACSQDTVCLSLDAAGSLVIPVESLYTSIDDNCHLLKPAMVQKLDGFSLPETELNFDCSVLGDTCMVQVIATDQYDNSNACMRVIVVKDEVPPFLACPPARTVNCEFPLNLADLSNFGEPLEVTDACGVEFVFELEAEDTGFTCMTTGGVVRTVTRSFEAIDSSGNTTTCEQVISIIDEDPFTEEDIMWLDDVQVACMGATSVDSLGQPGIMSDACSQILFDHTDMTFDLRREACRRIMRIWKVIDWCQYERDVAGNVIAGEWIDTQYIDIVSDVLPSFTGTYPDRELCAQSCDGGLFQMSFSGTPGCSDFGVFGYIYNIQLEDGRIIQSTGNNINQMLPLGTHNVILTIRDNCHQINTESFTVTIKDCKPPAIVCINGLVVNLMDTNPPMVPLWASDFSNGTKDNCTADDDIVYSFAQDTSVTQRIFECREADRNLAVTIYAMDTHGNQSSCETTLMVQANGISCTGFLDPAGETIAEETTGEEETSEDNAGEEETTSEEDAQTDDSGMAMVSGLIKNHKGEGIMNTQVNIQSTAIDTEKMTSNEGGYAFESLEMYKDYMIRPSKKDDILNGVSTLDIVLIQKHVLGLSVIEDPYLRIAADVDGSKRISARDLVELRKLILGSLESFTNNDSWRFVDASYDMSQNDPWSFPEEIEFLDLEKNEMSTDFIGVKIGDINGNASTQLDGSNVETRSSEKMKLTYENIEFEQGENLIVSIKSSKGIDLTGLQLALEISEALELVDVISGELGINNEHYRIENNNLLISWTEEESLNLREGDEMFKLAFRTKASGNITNAMQIKTDRLTAEVYDNELNIQDIVLDDNVSGSIAGFEMYQNKPNPFIAATEIEFVLPRAMEASIMAYDVKGQLLMTRTDVFSAGANRIMITKDQLGISSGVIYYRLEAEEFSDVKTMILIE